MKQPRPEEKEASMRLHLTACVMNDLAMGRSVDNFKVVVALKTSRPSCQTPGWFSAFAEALKLQPQDDGMVTFEV